MAHLVALGQEVSPVVLRGRDLDGHALDDLEAIAFDADDLLRIVGQDPQTLGAEIDATAIDDLVGFHAGFAGYLDLDKGYFALSGEGEICLLICASAEAIITHHAAAAGSREGMRLSSGPGVP